MVFTCEGCSSKISSVLFWALFVSLTHHPMAHVCSLFYILSKVAPCHLVPAPISTHSSSLLPSLEIPEYTLSNVTHNNFTNIILVIIFLYPIYCIGLVCGLMFIFRMLIFKIVLDVYTWVSIIHQIECGLYKKSFFNLFQKGLDIMAARGQIRQIRQPTVDEWLLSLTFLVTAWSL